MPGLSCRVCSPRRSHDAMVQAQSLPGATRSSSCSLAHHCSALLALARFFLPLLEVAHDPGPLHYCVQYTGPRQCGYRTETQSFSKNLKSALSTVLHLLHTSTLSSSFYASPPCINIVAYSPRSCTLPLFSSPRSEPGNHSQLQLPTFTPLQSPIPQATLPGPQAASHTAVRSSHYLFRSDATPISPTGRSHLHIAVDSREVQTASLSNCRGETEVALWQRSGRPGHEVQALLQTDCKISFEPRYNPPLMWSCPSTAHIPVSGRSRTKRPHESQSVPGQLSDESRQSWK